MTKINTEMEHKASMERIEELLLVVDNNTPADDKNLIELTLLSNLVADYEEEKFPIAALSLVDVIKLRMYEMDLTQKSLSDMVGVSPSRISEYLNGKSEPPLSVARNISKNLKIDAAIVLGV
ncbi:MAG: helix-turn-helix domain-containing protein [Candidatus Symbiothrix sp.]|nr:helix-turn-helix domain-containing protein [Candidatus Symbiothrix sp.]